MRILLSSFSVFFLVGCVSYSKKKSFEPAAEILTESLNPYFSDPSQDYVYKASIEAFDRSFGGLLIIKKLGTDHHRIVFTTEMGNTLFDFTFQEEDFKVNRIFKEMDKKIVINILKRDFKVLIAEHPPVIQTFKDGKYAIIETKILSKKHYFYLENNQLIKIIRVGSGNEKVEFLFSRSEDNIAEDVQIIHKTFPLEISLDKI